MRRKVVRDILTESKVYWNHSDNDGMHHAELTSGLHSDSFFNLSYLNDPALIRRLFMTDRISTALKYKKHLIDCVCGQAYGSIAIGTLLADYLKVPFIFTEKDKNGNMILDRYSEIAKQYRRVLIAEDVLTTGKTSKATIDLITNATGQRYVDIFTVINRTGELHLHSNDDEPVDIISCIDVTTKQYDPKDCPLCRAGSTAIRPKKEGNWALLNTKST